MEKKKTTKKANDDKKNIVIVEEVTPNQESFKGTCPKCGAYSTFYFTFFNCIENCVCSNCQSQV